MIRRETELVKLFKRKNNPVLELKKHFSKRFAAAVEQFQSKILSEEDIHLLIDKEPTVAYVIERLRNEQREETKREANEVILNRDKELIDLTIFEVQQELLVLEEEFSRLMLTTPATPEEIKLKRRKLNELNNRIEATEIILSDLENCKANNFKSARGRPRKREDKSLIELAKEQQKPSKKEKNSLNLDYF